MAGGGVATGGARRREVGWWLGRAVMWSVFSTAWALGLATRAASTATMWTESFEEVAHVKLLVCSQAMGDNSGLAFSRLKLQEVYNDSAATVIVWFLKDGARCTGGAMFASCDVETGRNVVTLRTVLTDLQPGLDRRFQCLTTYLGSTSLDLAANLTVNYTERATTTTTPELTTTTTEVSKHESAGASTVTAEEFNVPNTVVFVILALLIFFIVTCCALAVIYFRGRRKKRRAGDCDALSVRSGVTDKDFWFGGRSLSAAGTMERPGGRILRQYSVATSSPPVAMAPEVPGCNRLVMQYQRPSDSVPDANTFTFSADRGYVSGSSVHYQEPWGRTLDDQEVVSKLSTLRTPIRALVKIPDFQGSPAALLPPSAPPPDQGSPPTTTPQRLSVSSSTVTPTQETESTQA